MARTVFFDADDTLWDEQGKLQTLEFRLEDILDAATGKRHGFRETFADIEGRNIPTLGYGMASYMFSLGVAIAAKPEWAGHLSKVLPAVRALGAAFYDEAPEVFPGVEAALRRLKQRGFRLGMLTRGQNAEQMRKIEGSGLADLFDLVHVVPRKDCSTYRRIAQNLGGAAPPCMVGNSMRSDIEPAWQAGWLTIMVPAPTVWGHDKSASDLSAARTTVASSIAEAADVLCRDSFWLSSAATA